MTTTRERLQDLLDALQDDQLETVLAFAEAVRKGRAVVSACDVTTLQIEVEDVERLARPPGDAVAALGDRGDRGPA